MNIATAYVEIRADTAAGRRDAVTGARKIADEASAAAEKGNRAQVESAERAGRKIRDEQDKTVRKAKSAAQQIGEFFAAAAFLKGVNDSVNAASRLQQSVGATEAVFKSSSRVIDDFAKSSADAYGISSSAARELTAQIGSLLKGFGFTTEAAAQQSVVLAKLGADLAATFGGKPEEAVQALGAALRGEFDPLERFGISLNVTQANLKAVELGLATSTSNVDLNARAQAALAIIMERSADAQGQFAREADTYAGQQARATAAAEDARAKFGEQLLPVMTRVQQAVGFLAEGFGELPGPIQLGAVGLLGFVALAGPVQTLTGNVKDLVTSMKNMSKAGAIASGAAAGIAAAVVIGYVAYQSYTAKQREVAARSKEVAEGLRGATQAALDNADAANGAAIANDALATALANNGEDGEKLTRALGTLGITVEDGFTTLIDLSKDAKGTLYDLAIQAGATAEEAELLAKIVGDAGRSGDSWGIISERLKNAGVSDEILAMAAALEELEDQRDKVDIDASLRDWIAETAAVSDTTAALVKQAEAESDRKRTGEDLLPLYEKITELAKEQGVALDGTAEAAEGAGDAVSGFGDDAKEASRKTSDLSEAVGPLTGVLDALDEAAGDLASTLDKLFGRYTSMEEANRGLQEATDGVAKSIEDNGATLDINTEAGRKNREEIQRATESIDEWAEAFVRGGGSTQDAVAGIDLFTAGLRQQLIDAGLTEEAVDTYLATLGRTPENVQTTVELLDEQEQARKVQDFIDKTEEIPTDVFTAIEAALGEGDLEAANDAIDAFLEAQRQKSIRIPVTVSTGRPVVLPGGVKVAAKGDILMGPQFLLAGEAGKEAVLPLTDPTRMEQLVNDPRVRPEVLAALAAGGPGTLGGLVAMASGGIVGSSTRSGAFGTAVTTVFGRAGDAETATRGLIAAIQELREGLKETHGDLTSNLDNIDAQRDAILKWAEAQIAAGRSTEDVAEDVKYWIQDLRDNAVQMGVNEQALDDYLQRINLVPESVDTVIELIGAEEAKRQLDDLRDSANEMGSALDQAMDAVRRRRDELVGVWESTVSLDRAQTRVAEGQAALAGTVFDAGSRIDRGAGRDAALDQLDAIWQLAQARVAGGESVTAVQADVDQQLAGLREALIAGGVSAGDVGGFLRRVGRSPRDFAAMLQLLAGSDATLGRLTDASGRLDQAVASGDAAAIASATGAAGKTIISITTQIGGNVYGDTALQRAMDERDAELAAQLRQALGI